MANSILELTRQNKYTCGAIETNKLTIQGNLYIDGKISRGSNENNTTIGEIINGEISEWLIELITDKNREDKDETSSSESTANENSTYTDSTKDINTLLTPSDDLFVKTIKLTPGIYILKAGYKINNLENNPISSGLKIVTDMPTKKNDKGVWEANEKLSTVLIEKSFVNPAHLISQNNTIDIVEIKKETILSMLMTCENITISNDKDIVVVDKDQIVLQAICVGLYKE